MNLSKLRLMLPLAIMIILTVAYVANLDFGTLSAFGWATFSLICPLGALSAMLAAKLVIPRAIISLVVVIILMVILGRAFCAWACPVPVLQKLREIFSRKAEDDTEHDVLPEGTLLEDTVLITQAIGPLSSHELESLKANSCSSCAHKRGDILDSRHVILGGSVLTALIFGFPVFCLICPIGLAFGTIFLIVNLFTEGAMTWAVILVPLLLLAETVFFRKWCSKFCPLSAFMSLMGRIGHFFRPKIDDSKCLETSAGTACGICGKVCPEAIDPRHPNVNRSAISECTKCRICVESCPSKAITLPLWTAKQTLTQNKLLVSERENETAEVLKDSKD